MDELGTVALAANDGWAHALPWGSGQPDAGDVHRWLEGLGYTGVAVSVTPDGAVLVNATHATRSLPDDWPAFVPVEDPQRIARRNARAILGAYLSNPTPTGASTVEALKALIRVVRAEAGAD